MGDIARAEDFGELLQRAVDWIDESDSCLVVGHYDPDGDSMGSTLALAAALRELGKDVTAYNQDPVPYICEFLRGSDRVRHELPDDAEFDLTFVLDCSSPDRVGSEFPQRGWGERTVVIDHHRTWDQEFADLYLRDESAAATGELVYDLLEALELDITSDIAECLYCAVMTDTGGFRYSNTSKRTFQVAGELLDAGVDPWRMASHVYESQPLKRIELLREVLETLRLSDCGRLAFIRIPRSIVEGVERPGELTDGFINYGRSVRGVEVSTQLRELEGAGWKVTFRSRGNVDVSKLAERFGGGGHHNAAGCEIYAEADDIEASLESALVDLLDGDPESGA